jgi:hypothetical protein
MNCKNCNKEFKISPSRIGNKYFCSIKCHSDKIRKKTEKKYKRITVEGKRTLEHRHKMEIKLSRKLERWEHVHHINGDSLDNRIENLFLMDIRKHAKVTHKENRYD